MDRELKDYDPVELANSKEYYDSVICTWLNSPHKGSWIFTLQTTRGYEYWDYIQWRDLIKQHIGLTLTLDASDVDSISNKIMPFVRNNRIEKILK